MNLNTSVSQLNRVGKTLEKRLASLGIQTVRDVLFHFPFRYEDFSKMTAICDLHDGQQTTVKAKIHLIGTKRSPKKRMMITEAVISDGHDQMRIVWFKQPYIAKQLKAGDVVYFSGKVTRDMYGLQMVSPSYEIETVASALQDADTKNGKKETVHTARIVPLYPLTQGITHKQMRFLMDQVIDLVSEVEEWIPKEIQQKAHVISIKDALKHIHFPDSQEMLDAALRRLKFDEVFVLQLRAHMIRQSIAAETAPQIIFDQKKAQTFVSSLPYALTDDQKKTAWQIIQDMQTSQPMNRLLEGDVGSGKTVVAAFVMHHTVSAGYQAAIMAPTEVLAVQHYESLTKLLPDVSIGLITGANIESSLLHIDAKTKKEKKNTFKQAIQHGDIDIVIGTHALLTDDVQFKHMALAIVDEQHRFGVEQRKKLREKSGISGTYPHFLSMTATPIPRSFALTLYGELDISQIKKMPKGRKPVTTRVVDPHLRSASYDFIRDEIAKGRQAFVICSLIEHTEDVSLEAQDTIDVLQQHAPKNEKKTVMEEYEKLSQHVFPDLRVGYLHGKMKSVEKDDIMKKFAQHDLDILVSTSVIEVGVNIPNATVMMIEGAESFGLAQLHQFRGRVGRAEHQSYCFLFPTSTSKSSQDRLQYFAATTDGFKIAEYDLETRGPGQVYGTSQSGMEQFKLATMKDVDLIQLARDIAGEIDFDIYPKFREEVREWERKVHLE